MLREFLINRAKNKLGSKFHHFGTGQEIETVYHRWSAGVSKLFGGLYVSCGNWVVWTASNGWEAKSLKQ